jgi:conjugal transfer mating pair stabilization protein TraN
MRCKPVVVWLASQALVFVQTTAFAQSHEQGVAAGNAANGVVRGLVNEASSRSVVPGYTNTTPESALSGEQSLRSYAASRLAWCSTRPADPTCQGILNARTSANTPRPAISPTDPAVTAASNIARNPSAALGSLSAYYSGCVTSEVTTPATVKTRDCTRYVGGGSHSCGQRLSVSLDVANNCPAGEWFAHGGAGPFGLDAQCIPDRAVSQQHMRLTYADAAVAHFDVDMSGTSSCPPRIATLPAAAVGSAVDFGVWAKDSVCTAGNCTLTALIAPESVETCTGNADTGFTCTMAPTFLPVYGPCATGTLSGGALQVTECQSFDNCATRVLGAGSCYRPDPKGNIVAIDLTGTYTSPTWTLAEAQPIVGCRLNPAAGTVPEVKLSYVLPGATVAEFDKWDDACPAASTNASRCAAVGSPRCVEGPSTKVIDGREVTRSCWAYETSMACSSAQSADQCVPLAASGCTPLTSTCTQTSSTSGLCEVFHDQYSCAVPPETFTTASNCPRDVFCIGGGCFNIGYANDPDFARSMSMLEATREAGIYLDTDQLQVFKGEDNRCRDRLLTNCCTTNAAGRSMTNQSVFGGGSRLVYDILTNSGNRQFIYQGLSALLTAGGFSGSFTSYGVTIAVNGTALPAGSSVLYSSTSVAGEGFVIAFDPWSLAITAVIYIALSLVSCNAHEAKLALKEGAGLCHTIDSYCSTCIRVLGVCISCIEHTTSKCCFNSLISRIINEQGRLQVAKGWGGATAPDCSGFTIAQLQTLNFAAMDLSEFYASLVPKTPDVTGMQATNASRVPACYFGQGRCQ